jgi:signal transduction histidine kinase/response regulator of citrate/malate metabolism
LIQSVRKGIGQKMSDKPFITGHDELLKRIRQLEEELSFYHDMMNYIPGHIYWLDQDNRYLGCNQEHANNIGLKNRLDIVGKTNDDMPWKEIAEIVNKTNKKVMRTGKAVTVKETGIVNGVQSTFLSQKVPLKNHDNEAVGILGISINITELEELQKSLIEAKKGAEAASEAKTEFLENMRHDIRTPLTGIVGFADLLQMQTDDPHIREYSENLVASSHALLDLLDEVLEAIRVSSGEIPRLKKKFNLEQTLNHVIDLNRSCAAQKKLSLTLDIDPSLPNFLIGDKVRLHRVALELIANALNFTDTGFVKLSAALVKKNERKIVLQIKVEDSGIGIPKEKQQEIYVQFKRLTPSYQGIYKGAGLGLSVVKQFIDELDGEIYVDSEPRRGTTFTCLIPLQEPLIDDASGVDEEFEKIMSAPFETTFSQEIKPAILSTTDKQEFKVLLVEDNPIAQKVAESILSKMRCAADIAETGKKAIDLWKASHYDLVFMDIGLPDMDGYEVTHQIRLQELAKKTHAPIIALTAHAGEENKKRCIDAGMNAVLTKPLTPKNCTDMLEAFIPGYQQKEKDAPKTQWAADLPETESMMFDLSMFPVFDVEEGLKTMGNEETLAEILKIMVEESLPPDLKLLQTAHERLDWDKTQQLAHKIKGGAVYAGTMKLKMACQYLERYWKSGRRELLEPLYQQTVAVIEESMPEIRRWLKAR